MKKVKRSIIFTLLLAIIIPTLFVFGSCKKTPKEISLFNTQTETIEKLNFEEYIEGVVAGEIDNDSPIEALKAQAVLARTFVMKFIETGKSKYENADISTDINEAQAYSKEKVNSNIKKAVKETKGIVVRYNGELIDAYFHSNAGGQTAALSEGFNSKDELGYIKSVKTDEENTKDYRWEYSAPKDEVLSALRNMGVSVNSITSFKKGEIGESGRCLTFLVGAKEIDAKTFRAELGSTKLRSTKIESISVSNNNIVFSGLGYGHGVGLSQENAIKQAEAKMNYKDIISYYFDGVTIGY